LNPEAPRDAPPDYSQPCRPAKVLHLWCRLLGQRRRPLGPGEPDRAAPRDSPDLLRSSPQAAGLRSAPAPALPVRSARANPRGLRVRAAPRRADCPFCGVTVEEVAWSDGKSPLTIAYRWFLAGWAKRLSWQEVATAFHTSWEAVYRSAQYAVSWGLERRQLSGIEAIGVDEVQWRRGHPYLTVVYQIDPGTKRLL